MIVTFYSYKGGVGRTLALANIACLLAEDTEHPQSVLLWDFDLEAPGLHRLFPARQPYRAGFVDLVYEYATSERVPDLSDYIYTSELPGVDILPAGRVDAEYADKLGRIDWGALFQEGDDRDALLPALLRQCATYDYVLVDSRTGLNDQSGICTQYLPGLVAMLFRLTDQNLDGLTYVVPIIQQSGDQAKEKPTSRILPVASAVGSSASAGLSKQRERAQSIFGNREMEVIRFDPDLVDVEKLFSLQSVRKELWPTPPVVTDYERLSWEVRKHNDNDTRTVIRRLREDWRKGDWEAMRDTVKWLLDRRPALAETWSFFDNLVSVRQIRVDDAESTVSRLLERHPDNSYALRWLGILSVDRVIEGKSEELGRAKDFLLNAVETGVEDADTYELLSRIYAVNEEIDEGISLLRKGIEKIGSARLRISCASLLLHKGRDFMSSALDEVAEIHDGSSRSLVFLAYLRASLGEAANARATLSRVRDVDGPSISLFRAYVELFVSMNSPTPSASWREWCVDQEIKQDKVNWGEFLMCAGEYDRAINILYQAQEETPKLPDAMRALTSYLRDGSVDRSDVLSAWRRVYGFQYREMLSAWANWQGIMRNAGRWEIVKEIAREGELRECAGAAGGFFNRRPLGYRKL